LLLLTLVIAVGLGWWLERTVLTKSRDGWRAKAEDLERATIPYTYYSGGAGGFKEDTLRIPIVPEELQRALKRAAEAEAELRQRRIADARLREMRRGDATGRTP
jgi:hypothetical protein